MKFLCDQCKAKYQIADEKVVGKTVRMKCRKCGHLIEVRAAVTESSAVGAPSSASPPAGGGPLVSNAPPKPAPPRSTSLAASLTSARPAAPKPDRLPSTLAGTFKSVIQREEETSAPFDMAEISPTDDWYVAINGVPVGPIRVGEIRRKASLGAVTVESLVWQEGLDEWRPLRTFPDLAAIVREAVFSGRTSMAPLPETRSGASPPPARSLSSRPAPPAAPPRSSLPRPAAPPRSNVVAITSRLATAERIDEGPSPLLAPRPAPLIAPSIDVRPMTSSAPDPFAVAATVSREFEPIAETAGAAAPAPRRVEAGRKSPPWIAIAMVAAAIAFGVTAAVALFLRPAAPPPQPVVVQVPVPASTPTGTAPAAVPVQSTAPTASAAAPAKPSGPWPPRPSVAPSATGRFLDLHGLAGNATVAPAEEPGAGDNSAGGAQCISQGQLLQVIGQHQVAVRRSCWDRNQNTKSTVGVSVSMTISGDGVAQAISASGDDPAVAKCIENDVRAWRFPAMGCSQKVNIPFKFVRQ